MSDLRIRRNRSFAVPQYQAAGKTEKSADTGTTQKTGQKAGVTLSDTLQQMIGKMGEEQLQEVRRALQTNESVLAEVQDLLDSMEKLAQQAQEEGGDGEALQSQLEQLKDELLRVLDAGEFNPEAVLPMDEESLAASGLDVDALVAYLAGAQAESLSGFDLLMGLLEALEGGSGEMGLLDALATTESTAAQADLGSEAPAQPETVERGSVQITGRETAGVKLDPETQVLTMGAEKPILVQGGETEAPTMRFVSEGLVAFQQVRTPAVTVEVPQARLITDGKNATAQLTLKEDTTLTIGGGGSLHIAELRGEEGSALRVTSGEVVIEEQPAPAPIEVDGPASLAAPQGALVRDAQGETLTPHAMTWQADLPDWESVTALAVDGRQGPMNILKATQQEAVRLWLRKGDESQGFPAHSVVLQGRDKAGRLKTRYVYLRWDQKSGKFTPQPQYPNPFTVTGGEPEIDWHYDESTRTLQILTSTAQTIAGGTGEDPAREPFSGRLSLGDGIGPVTLTLAGVTCQVPVGQAFRLGRGNHVTLLLASSTENVFESGAGCAGISLGDGTSLTIDKAGPGEAGTLTATGGAGSPGIGRDSGVGQELMGPILIRGGTVKSTGNLGGVTPEKTAAPRFSSSTRSLHLEALDIRTREAAQAALDAIKADRRQIERLQKTYRAAYGRIENGPTSLRDAGEAGSLLWDMREQLENSSMAAYSQWVLDDVGQLLW